MNSQTDSWLFSGASNSRFDFVTRSFSAVQESRIDKATMGSIRLQPETAVLTNVSYVEPLISRYPCSPAQQQPKSPHFLISLTLRPAEFRKKSSSGAFADLSRRLLHVAPLKSLPDGPGNSNEENAASYSDDGMKPGPLSGQSSSGSQSGQPYVPGDIQQNKASATEDPKKNAAQSAFERAAAYKKLKILSPTPSTAQPGKSSAPPRPPETELPQMEILRGENIQSRLRPIDSVGSSSSDSSTAIPSGSSPVPTNVEGAAEDTNVDVRRFIQEKKVEGGPDSEDGRDLAALPPSKGKQEPVSLAAFERAKAYKQQQTEMVAALRGEALDESSSLGSSSKEGSGPDPSTAAAADEKVMEIEIITRDGVIKRKLMNPEEQMRAFSNIKDVKRQGVSGIDFAGLGFADKKTSGRRAGLSENLVAPPTGALPEVEILTRDAGSPQTESAERPGKDAEQLYKPRVSTWGVFPRPADISKAYGGGRTIRPGESLETEEERKVREARTQKLLADYRKKMGLDVDPKIKAEAEQFLNKGARLMDNGRLREALTAYETAMNKMPAQSESHGRAALQAAVCLDSLGRYDEAKQVYEKLLAHPNGGVRKQARRFLFGFTAMEKLKVDGGYKSDTSLYRKYFDSFADGYNSTYKAGNGEETNENLLPYALLLLCPILLVLALAASKSG